MRRLHTPKFLGAFTPLLALAALAAPLMVSPASAGVNPSGSTLVINSGSYNYGSLFDGEDNYGTIIVVPGSPGFPQFNTDFLGLYNSSGTAFVSGGVFNNDYAGFDTEHGSIFVSGGTFNNSTYGVFNNLNSTAVVSGGTLGSNGIGLLNWSSTAYVTGGTYTNNSTNLQDISGTVYLSGGTFSHIGTNYDLLESAGTTNVYGTAFSVPAGNLPQGNGSFTWTQANGSVQTLTYDNISGGTIDLILGAPPIAAPEMSPSVSVVILSALTLLMILIARKRPVQDGLSEI